MITERNLITLFIFCFILSSCSIFDKPKDIEEKELIKIKKVKSYSDFLEAGKSVIIYRQITEVDTCWRKVDQEELDFKPDYKKCLKRHSIKDSNYIIDVVEPGTYSLYYIGNSSRSYSSLGPDFGLYRFHALPGKVTYIGDISVYSKAKFSLENLNPFSNKSKINIRIYALNKTELVRSFLNMKYPELLKYLKIKLVE